MSAFAPICNPMNCAWGLKAFTGYLGADQEAWKAYDATVLMREKGPFPFKILIDQGGADKFYPGQSWRHAAGAVGAHRIWEVSIPCGGVTRPVSLCVTSRPAEARGATGGVQGEGTGPQPPHARWDFVDIGRIHICARTGSAVTVS